MVYRGPQNNKTHTHYHTTRSPIYRTFPVHIIGRNLFNNTQIDIELSSFCLQQCVLLMRFYLVKIRQELDSLPNPRIKRKENQTK